MKRRKFLQAAATLAGMPVLLKGVGVSAWRSSSLMRYINPESDRVLVIVRLNGGNDGLNTVLPIDQYDKLAALRPDLLIPESAALNLTDELALHPALSGLKGLYDDARLTLIQNVGYPNQNRSHFRSTDIWTSASPADEQWLSGWLGRYLDLEHSSYPTGYPNADYPHPFAITMGSVISQTCQGSLANYSLALDGPLSVNLLPEGSQGDLPMDQPYGYEVAFLRGAIAQTNAYSEVLVQVGKMGVNAVEYPDTNLGEQLRKVAMLVSGGSKTKIYVVSEGGFDTHANQVVEGEPTEGNHATRIQRVSDAIAAFQLDLKAQGLEERVLGITFSEFGRQIAQNGSRGTDHGTAAPLFMFGACLNPGIVGDNAQIPSPDEIEPQAGVPMQYDFRNIYGSILMDWFELEEEVVQQLIFEDFQYLPLIAPCAMVGQRDEDNRPDALSAKADLQINPNPFASSVQIRFSLEQRQHVHLSVFDLLGHERQVLLSRDLPSGKHELTYASDQLPAGTYALRLQWGNGQALTRLITKL